MPASCRKQASDLLRLPLAAICGAYFVICLSLYPVGSDHATSRMLCRFSPELYCDNTIPLIFAEQLIKEAKGTNAHDSGLAQQRQAAVADGPPFWSLAIPDGHSIRGAILNRS